MSGNSSDLGKPGGPEAISSEVAVIALTLITVVLSILVFFFALTFL